jgi:hypothetical protein
VIDYMVMEAVALKVRTEDEKAEKQRQREEFKKDKSRLNKFR